ncbi:MAG: hypothetical protein HAW60_00405 [Bdellovibrionales bacterium]|nr:hypothetical protein [Bdellovibrionales bacterium]
MLGLFFRANKKKLLILWYLSIFFTSPLMAIGNSNSLVNSDQNIDKKYEFYSHLCQLQTYMMDPSYRQAIKKKYSNLVIFTKKSLQKYNPNSTSDYTIQNLLDRTSLFSPFSIFNSTKIFKKELSEHNVVKLLENIKTFSQFLKHVPKNKELNSCIAKQYPSVSIKQSHAFLSLDKKRNLLTELKKISILYESLILKNDKQALKKIYNSIAANPINSILVNLKSRWSIKLNHYLRPELTKLGVALTKNKSIFTKNTYKLLDKKLKSSIVDLQKLTKNICKKNITNLHHNVFTVEETILKHSAKAIFADPVITEDLAAYCYLKSTEPKKNIQATWKSYSGLGIAGVSIIARLFGWIGSKTLAISGATSTALFAKETYDNWRVNLSNKNIYDINKYSSKSSLKNLKNLKKNQDLIYLEGGLLLFPALMAKLTNISRSRKIKKVSSKFKTSQANATSNFLNTKISSPSKWWPYYNSLIKQLKIKPFKQFFWAKHNRLKNLKITNAEVISKKSNDFFSRINQNYITPARYLKNNDFVSTLLFLKNAGTKNLSKKSKSSIIYIKKLISKSNLYKANIDKIITQGLEATARLKKLKAIKIKSKHFNNNKKVSINNWPTAKNGKLLNTDKITINSYNEYKSFISELKIRSNYLPSKAVDDLFQKKQLYLEQLSQASNIRKLQIIESKLNLLKKTQKLNSTQTNALNSIKETLKNSNIYPPNRAFRKVFLKELVEEIKYLKQGVNKRTLFVQKSYSSFPKESADALSKTQSFLSDHIKQIFWTGTVIGLAGGTTMSIRQVGVDYVLANLQDKMRNIARFFSKNGHTLEEENCALNSTNFKKFIICYNELIKKETKLSLLEIRNFEFIQNNSLSGKDENEYRLKLYSSIKKKLREYTYKLLELRSKFNVQEFFYNIQTQMTAILSEQFIYKVLGEIKLFLGEESFAHAKSILTLNISQKDSLKKINNLNKNANFKHAVLLQTILYKIYNNKKQYGIYFKNTGQIPIELKALIQNKDLIQLQDLNSYEEFNTISGGLLEEILLGN